MASLAFMLKSTNEVKHVNKDPRSYTNEEGLSR